MFDKKEYQKKWFQKNKKYHKKWYYRNEERRKAYCKLWYQKNKKHRKECMNQWYKKNKDKNLNNWEKYIPKKTNCQVCGKNIYFNQNNRENAIHFDHKSVSRVIKRCPTGWLNTHSCNTNNYEIWKKCKFGMLCKRCNSYLPTKNRKQFIKNIIRYVLKGYKLCKI